MPPMAIWVVNMIIHKLDTPSDAGTSCQPQPKPFRLRVPNNKQQAPQRQTNHFPNPQLQGLMVEVAFDGLDCQKFPESGTSAAVPGAVRSQTVQVQRGWWIGVGLCIFRLTPGTSTQKVMQWENHPELDANGKNHADYRGHPWQAFWLICVHKFHPLWQRPKVVYDKSEVTAPGLAAGGLRVKTCKNPRSWV